MGIWAGSSYMGVYSYYTTDSNDQSTDIGSVTYYSTPPLGSGPVPVFSVSGSGSTGGGMTITNGVYILGGTNSVLVINNPTQPIPVTLGGLDVAQEYFMQGLIYGSTLAAILLGFISVRRALSMGDAWND